MEVIHKQLYTTTKQEKPYKAWWTADDNDVHAQMIRMVKSIQELQRERSADQLRHAYLYQNRQPSDVMFGSAGSLPERFYPTYNVVKSCVDALTAKITSNRPRPRILTEKGDYEKQLRAKKLSQYIDGVLAASGAYEAGPNVFRDGGVFGTSGSKIIINRAKGRIDIEKVLISEIFVDDLEAAYGNPASIYQMRLVSRECLLELFPEHEDILRRCAPVDLKKNPRVSDMIRLYEGWHIGGNGRHVTAVEEGTLLDEPWEHECFPFAFYQYNPSISSFYGQGIAEELMGTQLEINKLLRDIQRAMHLIAVPRVLLEQNSDIAPAHLTNGIGSAIKYKGVKPDFFTPTAMNNEVYNHVRWLIASAFEKVGISQLSVAGKKPAGLDAAVALREYRDAESERFATVDARYRKYFNDLGNLVVTFSKVLYKDLPDLSITTESRRFIETIKWSDVDMDDDKFVSRIHSSSLFPTSPAAKLQKIEEYIRMGWMDRETGIQLMDFPDVDAWETLETADREYMSFILGQILGKGEYVPPEPEMMLDKDINTARKAYLEALKDGVNPDHVELLLRWIEAAATLLPVPPPPSISPAMPMESPNGLPPQLGPAPAL